MDAILKMVPFWLFVFPENLVCYLAQPMATESIEKSFLSAILALNHAYTYQIFESVQTDH